MSKRLKPHKQKSQSREIKEYICDEPSCKFYGENRVQGVCHTQKGELADFDELEKHEAAVVEELKGLRQRSKSTHDYVKSLEAYYITAMLNWTLGLDELVRLRRDNALLRQKSKKKSSQM